MSIVSTNIGIAYTTARSAGQFFEVLANILVGVVNSEISQKDIAEDSNCNFPWGASAFDASEN